MSKSELPVICFAGHHFYGEKQGGVELQTRYLAKALALSGMRVAFLSPSLEGAAGHEEINETMHLWHYPHFAYGYQAPTALLEKQLRAIRPALIYQRGRGQLLESRMAWRYARAHAIPYVYALSSDADLERMSFTKTLLATPKPVWKKTAMLPYACWVDRAMRHVLADADHIIAQHEGQAARIKTLLAREAFLLRTMHPTLKREPRKSHQKLVLFVTNYRPWKQGELFVQLAERCKVDNCVFAFVHGRTKQSYIGSILRAAQGQPNLYVLGELPAHEVESLMEEASLFVNTSLGFEGFPNTYVQSWLRETPTIALHVNPGGVLTRERIGLHSGNFAQLLEDVTFLLQNEEERIAMGKRARRYAEREHGFECNVQKIASLFSGMLRGRERMNFYNETAQALPGVAAPASFIEAMR